MQRMSWPSPASPRSPRLLQRAPVAVVLARQPRCHHPPHTRPAPTSAKTAKSSPTSGLFPNPPRSPTLPAPHCSMRSLILTGAEQHSINAVRYTRAFFLDSETAINPYAAYAQVIRGPPGSQEGGYEGVLDFNSLVKVVNAVQVLRFSGRPEWSGDIEAGILDWAGKYLGWLQASQQGQKAESATE